MYVNVVLFTQHLPHRAHVTGGNGATSGVAEAREASDATSTLRHIWRLPQYTNTYGGPEVQSVVFVARFAILIR